MKGFRSEEWSLNGRSGDRALELDPESPGQLPSILLGPKSPKS